ncbi:MAG: cytochrome c [bacterium]|nr:cytochrome c [bacterium]
MNEFANYQFLTGKGNLMRGALAAAVLVSVSACNYSGNLSGMHWFLDMHDSHAVESQEEDYTTLATAKGDGWTKGMDDSEIWTGAGSYRTPPEGSVPRNYDPYPYAAGEGAIAGQELQNPLPKTKAVLARGQKEYNAYCAVCHGYTGMGDGPVTPRFPDIPAVVSPTIMNWKDGEIFHIVTMGRARMYPYAAQINPEDRWSIVHYVRLLQEKRKQDPDYK